MFGQIEEDHVRAEQIRLLYRNSVRTPIGLLVLLAALAYLIAQDFPSPWPYAWGVAILAIYIARAWLAYRALSEDRSPQWLIRHVRITRTMTTFMGAVICVGLLVFFPMLSAEKQPLVTMLCIGWIAGAVVVNGAYPRYIMPWFVLVGGALVVAWPLFGTGSRISVSVLLALLVYYFGKTTVDLGQKTVDSIRIRFENVDLLKALEARQQDLEEATQTKSRFMAAASHDLRQPLMSISLLQGSLLQKRSPDDVLAIANKLGAPIRALESILDSLLEIARLDAGNVVPQRRPTELRDLAAQLRDEIAPRVDSTGLAFDVKVDAARVMLDAHLVMRILNNLLDNALKFTNEGMIQVAITRASPGEVELVVKDSGCGIPEADVSRVFEEFYQIGNPQRTRSKGIGLGLSIVRRLVSVLGGTITLESKEGLGTLVRVRIPAEESMDTAETPPQPQDTVSPPQTDELVRLMLVDDDPDIQDSVALWARGAGIEGMYAASAQEALDLAGTLTRPPDVVVSDYRLPGPINGIALLKRLQERWPLVPGILLTGDNDPSLRTEASQQGLIYVAKPVSAARLEEEIRRVAVAAGKPAPSGDHSETTRPHGDPT